MRGGEGPNGDNQNAGEGRGELADQKDLSYMGTGMDFGVYCLLFLVMVSRISYKVADSMFYVVTVTSLVLEF